MIHQALIHPRSIVVIGGSNDVQKPGGAVLRNLIRGQFAGELYVTNPKEKEVQGIRSYQDPADLPEVDLAQATLQCEYAREAVAFASQALPVTISIGVSAHRPGDTVGDWLQRADAALYAAKREGRDRVQAA